jgi:hypothetical protein
MLTQIFNLAKSIPSPLIALFTMAASLALEKSMEKCGLIAKDKIVKCSAFLHRRTKAKNRPRQPYDLEMEAWL